MKFGLDEKQFKTVEDLVLKPLKALSVKIFIFGSRVHGRHHPFSDIDLLLEPSDRTSLDLALSSIKESVEESQLPMKIDFVILDELAASYRERVLKERVEI